MRRRVKAILCVACFVLAAGAWCLWSTLEKEPSFQGKTLSYYVELNDRYYGGKPSERAVAAEAIQQIGSNAIPFLLKWIQYNEPSGMLEFRDMLDRKLGRNWFYSRGAYRANLSIHAFHALAGW